MSDDAQLYARALARIPGGTQLLSKRPEQFLPGQWPAYYRSARGAQVELLDGRTLTDVSLHAVGTCPLGYADPDVEQAVVDVIRSGNMATQSGPEEVALAELLCELHPWADMVRYTRGGGEAMAVAVRIARAATARSVVVFSGYHGWNDFYLAANLDDPHALDAHLLAGIDPAGVPESLRGSAIPFDCQDLDSLRAALKRAGGTPAAIILEPARYGLPPDGFLQQVRKLADETGAVLIFDEITSGFRARVGGIHLGLGVSPDLAVFAKAISNGYPMGTVIGRREVMEAVARTFISSSYWSERIGPTAALATIKKLRDGEVPARLCVAGERMRRGWQALAEQHGLQLQSKGIEPLPSFSFQHGEQARDLVSLYTQAMLDRGYLACAAFYASAAHTDSLIDGALEASDGAFGELRQALDLGQVQSAIRGSAGRPGPSRREG